MRGPQPNHKNSAVHAFLHEDDPTTMTLPPDEEFASLFPRNRRIGNGFPMAHKQSLQELLELVPEVDIASEDSETNVMNANLEIVDGWRELPSASYHRLANYSIDTLNVSSPMSVATPTTSQEEDKIDQLFLEDSPATEPASGPMKEKMGMSGKPLSAGHT